MRSKGININKIVIIFIIIVNLLSSNSMALENSLEYNTTMDIKDEITDTIEEHIVETVNSKALQAIKMKSSVTFFKKADKVLAFIDSSIFKNSSLSILQDATVGGVVMMAIENGQATYTLLKGGITYKKVSKLLLSQSNILLSEGFKQGLIYIMPPPSSIIVITSVAGAYLVEYAVNKYIELDKRGYIGLEDMLWYVPSDIKNKITILNLEDIKRESVFDFGDIDEENILDNEADGHSLFDEANESKTILDY